jgi:hypothetical protein
MVMDLIPALEADTESKIGEIIPAEIFHPMAVSAQKQVLVPINMGNVCMATILLVDTLYEIYFFQFFQGPVNRNQSHSFAPFARLDKDIHRSECSVTLQYDLNDHLPGTGDPVSAFVNYLGPVMRSVRHMINNENDNHYHSTTFRD